MPEFQTFKDLSVTFKKHPVTDDFVVVKDKAAIIQSIRNLLLTQRGERPFQPDLGSDIYRILFEPLDYASGALIKEAIFRTLNVYEPRIRVDTVLVSPDNDNNGYNVEISFTIVGRDDQPLNVDFFLESTR
jgi:phage baseplate assembly protein W